MRNLKNDTIFLCTFSARAKIERAPQHPESMEAIRHLEDYEKYQRQESIEETISQQPPVFIKPLQSLENLIEGGFAHFEAQITPVSDPTMKVEWLFNGQPLTAGNVIIYPLLFYGPKLNSLISCVILNNSLCIKLL